MLFAIHWTWHCINLSLGDCNKWKLQKVSIKERDKSRVSSSNCQHDWRKCVSDGQIWNLCASFWHNLFRLRPACLVCVLKRYNRHVQAVATRSNTCYQQWLLTKTVVMFDLLGLADLIMQAVNWKPFKLFFDSETFLFFWKTFLNPFLMKKNFFSGFLW